MVPAGFLKLDLGDFVLLLRAGVSLLLKVCFSEGVVDSLAELEDFSLRDAARLGEGTRCSF